ncbi:MAG: DNA replication/repair protein RecF [Clostridia bacterium]|nr:DNA replication/repair protein RecF [Clostridia bacterium]
MRLERLSIKNFRNIKNIEILPCCEMNVICGDNAQGKTNIIEAIWLYTGAKSFRNCKDINFINFESEKAKTEIDFLFGGIKNNAVMNFYDKRSVILNNKELKSTSMMAGKFNAVIFSPNDLLIVTGSPEIRRRFLDTSIGQIYTNYIEILKNYKRAVIQRNKIIKNLKYDSTVSIMLEVFEKEIAENGKKIIDYRKKYIEKLSSFINDIYNGISQGIENIEIVYNLNCEKEDLESLLKEKRKEDMYLGITSTGPHRDDIEFLINGINSKIYGSQGQKRSISLSLKFANSMIIKEISGEYPVCLLDDVMSELDKNRQDYILNKIKGWQSFITCCDPDNIKGLKSGKIFNIKKGQII